MAQINVKVHRSSAISSFSQTGFDSRLSSADSDLRTVNYVDCHNPPTVPLPFSGSKPGETPVDENDTTWGICVFFSPTHDASALNISSLGLPDPVNNTDDANMWKNYHANTYGLVYGDTLYWHVYVVSGLPWEWTWFGPVYDMGLTWNNSNFTLVRNTANSNVLAHEFGHTGPVYFWMYTTPSPDVAEIHYDWTDPEKNIMTEDAGSSSKDTDGRYHIDLPAFCLNN